MCKCTSAIKVMCIRNMYTQSELYIQVRYARSDVHAIRWGVDLVSCPLWCVAHKDGEASIVCDCLCKGGLYGPGHANRGVVADEIVRTVDVGDLAKYSYVANGQREWFCGSQAPAGQSLCHLDAAREDEIVWLNCWEGARDYFRA